MDRNLTQVEYLLMLAEDSEHRAREMEVRHDRERAEEAQRIMQLRTMLNKANRICASLEDRYADYIRPAPAKVAGGNVMPSIVAKGPKPSVG